jgi:hypothetical protein
VIGLATALLIWLLVSKLWSILDPDSASYTLSPFRTVVTFAGLVAMLVLLLNVVAWSTAGIIAYIAGYLVLDFGASRAQGDL